ncbi:hypothetical protein [Escherichia coli ISC7]|uniref:Uncharacterized protein n=1 Tax=Escherichia coli ISC7 TaxID=1432555 RepID=W1EWD6_ECOLX|nr:hypothetical protein [Escherichia coli ISC7]CDL29950.1 hypothetical protein [Escherichia coli ISC7]
MRVRGPTFPHPVPISEAFLTVNGRQKHDRAVERGEREIGQNHG